MWVNCSECYATFSSIVQQQQIMLLVTLVSDIGYSAQLIVQRFCDPNGPTHSFIRVTAPGLLQINYYGSK